MYGVYEKTSLDNKCYISNYTNLLRTYWILYTGDEG